MWIYSTILVKINGFVVKTALGPINVIAKEMMLLKY